MAEVSFFL